MSIAEILEGMRKDKCNIYRNEKLEIEDITKTERMLIARDVRCRLSTKNVVSDDSVTESKVINVHTLFFHPDIDIQTGDKLEVTTSMGFKYVLYAGKPNGFAGSHIELNASENEYV